MSRLSKIDRLPEPVRDFIAQARGEGRTIDEIMAAVKEQFDLPAGALPVRSKFGKHVAELDELREKYMNRRAVAQAMALGQGDQSRLVAMLSEMVINLAVDLVEKVEDGETLAPEDIHDLAKALDHLTKARKTDATTPAPAKAEEKHAAPANDAAPRDGGIDPAAAEAARRIMGFEA